MHFIARVAARLAQPLQRIPYFATLCGLYVGMELCVIATVHMHPLSVRYFMGPAGFFWYGCAIADPVLTICAGTVLTIIGCLTVRRMHAVGWPPPLATLVCIPFLGDIFFLLATCAPETRESSSGDGTADGLLRRVIPRDDFAQGVAAMIIPIGAGLLLYILTMRDHPTYGFGIFIGLPFMQGCTAALLASLHGRRSFAHAVRVAAASYLATVALLLAFALEGYFCILIAAPLGATGVFLGVVVGHCISRSGRTPDATIMLLLLATPALFGAERFNRLPSAPIQIVTTKIVDAPPAVVWENVTHFSPLAEPTELIFKTGIAYPKHARIVGTGKGAIRYCEFSTGAFVEPVTIWQPGRVLAFDVRENPEPMRESSPYGAIRTPHLNGYLRSLRGRFDLAALPGNRTLLTGTTWYVDDVWPSAYWRLWSDYVIHAIHTRVLDHVAHLAANATHGARPAPRIGN